MGWVFGGGDSTEYGRGTREFAVVQKPTGLFSPVEKEKRSLRFEKINGWDGWIIKGRIRMPRWLPPLLGERAGVRADNSILCVRERCRRGIFVVKNHPRNPSSVGAAWWLSAKTGNMSRLRSF